ncbi:MAG TPA: hypothetical protein VLI07_18625 [Candidatus Binatus sp.]|nr:hypothetical protein [Candidatus Binatus sp.]
MNSVMVRKDELLEKITANRKAHRAIFEEAVEGYRKTAIEQLERHIEQIKEGRVIHVVVQLPRPEDHTHEYDRIIAMLEMHIDDEILIEEQDFAAYVMDDWHWKRQFLTTNSAYSATARRFTENA